MKYAFLFGILTLMLAQTSVAMDINEMLSDSPSTTSSLGQQDDFLCPALAESETREQPKVDKNSDYEIDQVSLKLGAKAI